MDTHEPVCQCWDEGQLPRTMRLFSHFASQKMRLAAPPGLPMPSDTPKASPSPTRPGACAGTSTLGHLPCPPPHSLTTQHAGEGSLPSLCPSSFLEHQCLSRTARPDTWTRPRPLVRFTSGGSIPPPSSQRLPLARAQEGAPVPIQFQGSHSRVLTRDLMDRAAQGAGTASRPLHTQSWRHTEEESLPHQGPRAGKGYSGDSGLGPRPPTEHGGKSFPELQQSQGWQGRPLIRQEEEGGSCVLAPSHLALLPPSFPTPLPEESEPGSSPSPTRCQPGSRGQKKQEAGGSGRLRASGLQAPGFRPRGQNCPARPGKAGCPQCSLTNSRMETLGWKIRGGGRGCPAESQKLSSDLLVGPGAACSIFST